MQIDGVIFDMDGLMFDTERVAAVAWNNILGEQGLEMTEEIRSKMRGATFAVGERVLKEAFGEDFDYKTAKARRNAWVNEYCRTKGVPVKKGLKKLLEELKADGVRCAVASSSPMSMVSEYLALAGVDGYFMAVMSGESVERSKPEPDIFLAAARAIGADPKNCLVLEDSANGLHAAYNAKMRAICIPDIVTPEKEIKAYAMCALKDLGEVWDYVKSL